MNNRVLILLRRTVHFIMIKHVYSVIISKNIKCKQGDIHVIIKKKNMFTTIPFAR